MLQSNMDIIKIVLMLRKQNFAGWVTHETGSTDREYLDEFNLEYFEVVGNIFDNPELLQEDTE